MEKQLSSLKWLRERLETFRQGEKNSQSYILIPTWKLETLMVIAEEMHKEEIVNACNLQRNDYKGMPTFNKSGEQYYKETYGGNNEQQ